MVLYDGTELPDSVHTEAGLAKCREKTARGNCFYDRKGGKRAAKRWSVRSRRELDVYRCTFCPFFHICTASKNRNSDGSRRNREWSRVDE